MSSAASPNHRLRLVGSNDSQADDQWHREQEARLAVVKENRIAAHASGMEPGFSEVIDAKDPRWVLAMQTQMRLQGATLTPERRADLLRSGTKLGLRPFESNLIIAIMQDRARAGEAVNEAGPMLSLVREPVVKPKAADVHWPQWVAVVAAAAAVAAILVRWLGS